VCTRSLNVKVYIMRPKCILKGSETLIRDPSVGFLMKIPMRRRRKLIRGRSTPLSRVEASIATKSSNRVLTQLRAYLFVQTSRNTLTTTTGV
jgi:hypothetical protein